MITRPNKFEDSTQKVIELRANIELIYQSYSAKAIEMLKQFNNKNKLFTDACSPYRTPYGNQRKNEFVLHLPLYDINWRIECKGQKIYNALAGRIDLELSYVSKIYEDMYCLILDKALYAPSVIYHIAKIIEEKSIRNKVWFGSLEQFDKMLCKQIKAATFRSRVSYN
jgi:hypothetical protein